jgi:hypothetical protein
LICGFLNIELELNIKVSASKCELAKSCLLFRFYRLGEQHYYNMDGAFGPNGSTALYSERDFAKISLCKERGITMILIPFWYDFME